jgi:MtN3 and saliva related transmembrane protein
MTLEVLAMVSGIAASYAYFPELRKIYKTKSARDVSLTTFGIWVACSAVWLSYGISIQNWVVVANYTAGLAGSLSVLLLSMYYDFRHKEYAVASLAVAFALILSPNSYASSGEQTLRVGESVSKDGYTITCENAGQSLRLADTRYRCVSR